MHVPRQRRTRGSPNGRRNHPLREATQYLRHPEVGWLVGGTRATQALAASLATSIPLVARRRGAVRRSRRSASDPWYVAMLDR